MFTKEELDDFCKQMVKNMKKKQKERGDSWREETSLRLWFRLIDEAKELKRSMEKGLLPSTIAREAADVANFALMIVCAFKEDLCIT